MIGRSAIEFFAYEAFFLRTNRESIARTIERASAIVRVADESGRVVSMKTTINKILMIDVVLLKILMMICFLDCFVINDIDMKKANQNRCVSKRVD